MSNETGPKLPDSRGLDSGSLECGDSSENLTSDDVNELSPLESYGDHPESIIEEMGGHVRLPDGGMVGEELPENLMRLHFDQIGEGERTYLGPEREAVLGKIITETRSKRDKLEESVGYMTEEYKEQLRIGKAAVQLLAYSNLLLSVSMTEDLRKKRNSPLEQNEAIQYGYDALLQSAWDYDPERGSFRSLLKLKIRDRIQFGEAKSKYAIALPPDVYVSLGKIDATIRSFKDENGRMPTIDELAEGANLDVGRTQNALKARAVTGQKWIELDKPASHERDHIPVSDLIADDEGAETEVAALDNVSREEILKAVGDNLDHRETTIIRQRYFYNSKKPTPYRQIGKEIGISPQTVVDIEKRILKRFREVFENMGYDGTESLGEE